MKKFFACLLALAFMFAFAACRGQNKPASGETAADTEAPTTAWDGGETTLEGTTAENESTTEADDTTQPDDDTATTEPGEETPAESAPGAVPADTAGILRYYNDALKKTPMQRSSYEREMIKITALVKAIGFTILDDPNMQWNPDLGAYIFEEDKTARPSDLVALEAAWVADAKSSVSGGTATLTITMKNHALDPVFDPKPGARGYVSTIDKATATQLVIDAAFTLADSIIGPIYPNPIKEVTVTDSQCGLSGGKYVVAIDTATGKIKSLTFTGTQQVEGNAKCRLNIPIIPASANAYVTLQGNLTAVYAPK